MCGTGQVGYTTPYIVRSLEVVPIGHGEAGVAAKAESRD